LFSCSSKLKQAYHLSHKLTSIFNSDLTKQQAQEKIIAWIREATELTFFNRFIKKLTRYSDEISNYFIARNSSGFVEGFNNRVKVLKRRCYGLAHRARLFQRIILDTVGFERFAPGVACG
jgi:transposase